MYPLKSDAAVIASASAIIDWWLLLLTPFPWWKVMEQKLQLPKQPLELVMLNFISLSAGIPPAPS